jgi:hypothetical protein
MMSRLGGGLRHVHRESFLSHYRTCHAGFQPSAVHAPQSRSLLVAGAWQSALAQPGGPTEPDWSFNAAIIDSCSCPMFCQCYFNIRPASHAAHGSQGTGVQRFCRFNRAFRINHGVSGPTNLAGLQFWMAGDLGSDFSKDQMDWAVLTFEPSAAKAQRTSITTILRRVYPGTWNSITTANDARMEWEAGSDRAQARLDGGTIAAILLRKADGMTNAPVLIQNLKYEGAPRNEGFILMPSELGSLPVRKQAIRVQGYEWFHDYHRHGFHRHKEVGSSASLNRRYYRRLRRIHAGSRP